MGVLVKEEHGMPVKTFLPIVLTKKITAPAQNVEVDML